MRYLIALSLVMLLFSGSVMADLVFPPNATIVYVHQNGGNDQNSGLSWAAAKQTVKAGLDKAGEYTAAEVWVAAGTYEVPIYTPRIFIVGANTSLLGGFAGGETQRSQRNPRSNLTILRAGAALDPSIIVVYTQPGAFMVDGFTVENGGYGIYCGGGTHISHNTVRHNRIGIYAHYYSGPYIRNNYVYEYIHAGIFCCSTRYAVVANNTVRTSFTQEGIIGAGYGIRVEGYCSGGGDCEETCVANNIVTSSTVGIGILNQYFLPVELENNDTYNNGTNYQPTPNPSNGNISLDPLFDATVPYKLTDESPCIDTGTDSAVLFRTETDFDGEPRKVDIDGVGIPGVMVDIGADEYYPDYENNPLIDRPLPTDQNNLNNAAGPNRCNIRWANSDYTTDYNIATGDNFTLPAGPQWVIEKIRVWAVPSVPGYSTYAIGDHFTSLALYIIPASGGTTFTQSGVFTEGANSSGDIVCTSAHYTGTIDYQSFDGRYDRIWQVDFNNLNWQISGGVTYVFGVHGTPRVDRLWFNHATNGVTGGDGQIRRFDVTNLSAGSTVVDPKAWFGGKGTDINVQIFARPQ